MTIIEISMTNGKHTIESHTYREACWLDGYIEVPTHLEDAAWASGGYCDLTIEDGVLTDITPLPIPEPGPVQPVIDPQEDTDAMLVDHELRLTLLELGGI